MDDDAARTIGETLAGLYAGVRAGPMRDVPICNDALDVEAIGFRAFGETAVGIVVTPWFMNLIVVPEPPVASGASVRVAVPAGDVECVSAQLDGFGAILACSLFSPMFEFSDMSAAREAAREAMKALFDPELLDQKPAPKPAGLDRRALLRGRLATEEATS
ncbi:[NiFe]-hydrogenase assembly chaperone HybE [Methylocystis sp. Sn-Cys]|uniref:[NiFe]-hydrogenase assembly chaperone HybE n=1 Tax=Methylocystis sp. Sn-Cys TaxID=1701263 RepID=UPI0019250BD0|nr:[NiFe]-hydrogenase assembly chaperone HybE [Methylocystis sp. Sn-Cys]MBL1256869.1 [NiFe]-hydrogenase assembly chaperone HybE [Methylocystis sp. Sn-Cys]